MRVVNWPHSRGRIGRADFPGAAQRLTTRSNAPLCSDKWRCFTLTTSSSSRSSFVRNTGLAHPMTRRLTGFVPAAILISGAVLAPRHAEESELVRQSAATGIQLPRMTGRFKRLTLTELADNAEFFQVALEGLELSHQCASGLVIEESAFKRVRLTGVRLRGARLLDVLVELCELSGAEWDAARWRRVAVRDSRLAGVQLVGATLEDVSFSDCGLESACLPGRSRDQERPVGAVHPA